VFSLIHGAGINVGQALVLHPGIRGVAFTGSLGGGRALFNAAAGRDEPIPVFSEMGSVNPVFVLPDALRTRPEDVAIGLHGSFTLGAGQFCTSPGVVVVRSGAGLETFTEKLATLTHATPPACMLHVGIRDAFERGAERLASAEGVTEIGRSSAGSDRPTDAAAVVFRVDAEAFLANERLREEVFGPATLLVVATSKEQVDRVAQALRGHLTATLIGGDGELAEHVTLMETLAQRVGRVIINGYPTGVEVTSAMQHGGPYPATTDPRFTSVGTAAIFRFVRPVAYQDVPDALLPLPLRDANPLGLLRLVHGSPTRDPIGSNA
jgi:NADP-dependent aldehyde dehydrogenase